ncbi:hypothetical protein [Streptomyces sp. yr375]|uniref:hypothetical protein n=1 Tax=Streptomyces sp. yr375 TaxID=1761906 RepID=UPI0015A6AFF2|nr:hypothetical protein [Streptomyces sp. yr375]
MGRVGRRTAGVQVTSRLTWAFSVRAGVRPVRSRPARSRSPAPALAAGGRVSAALVRAALRAARARRRHSK